MPIYGTHIANDGDPGQEVENGKPNADVLSSLGYTPSGLTDEFVGVQADLDPVVQEGEQGGEGECRHEDGYKPELKD